MVYGRKVLFRVGSGIMVQASDDIQQKIGGVDLAWEVITPAATTYQLTSQGEQATIDTLDNITSNGWTDIVESGEKFIRYGTVILKVVGGTYDGRYVPYGTASGSLAGGAVSKVRGDVFILNESVHESDDSPKAIYGGKMFKHRLLVNFAKASTVSFGGATGGTATFTYKGVSTAAQAFGVAAGALQTALEGLSTIGVGKVTVTGLGTSVSPFVITLAQSLAPFGDFTVASALIGGTGLVVGDAVDTAAGPSQAEFESLFPTAHTVNELN
jgi:hypothetical protein